jgi:CheY-like chemotaxis protein
MSGSALVVRVLVADDQDVFLKAAIAVVDATRGFRVVAEAGSGERAVELAAVHRPQLVLMDVRMPGIGGVAAARRIRESDPNVVVILLSANDAKLVACPEGQPLPVLDKAKLAPEVLLNCWEDAQTARGSLTPGGQAPRRG